MMKLSQRTKERLYSKYGEWAVITGASSGIGKEITLQLCESGFNVILIGRDSESLKSLQELIQEKFDVSSEFVIADLSQNEMDEIYLACNRKKIGLFVGSAGFGTSGNFINNSVHIESNMLQVNCDALMKLTHFFASRFAEQKRGGIILMSSMVAFQGVPFSANYAATKAYVQSLAEGLYHELKPFGVDVLAAAPGPVQSGFSKRANMKMDVSLTPEQVGIPILRALGKKMTILPGRLTKGLVYSLRTVPRWGKIRIMKLVMGGMTAHQQMA